MADPRPKAAAKIVVDPDRPQIEESILWALAAVLSGAARSVTTPDVAAYQGAQFADEILEHYRRRIVIPPRKGGPT